MSLEKLVPTQELCSALADAGLVQGKSVLVWFRYTYGENFGRDLGWKVGERWIVDWQSQHHKNELLDAPTASELGEILPMLRQFNPTMCARHFDADILEYWSGSETEARAQLILWLAKNRPAALGNV